MLRAVLEDVVLGWVLGDVLAALAVRRARRRGIDVDPVALRERYGVAGAAGLAVTALAGRLL